jgi:hypothetical protein
MIQAKCDQRVFLILIRLARLHYQLRLSCIFGFIAFTSYKKNTLIYHFNALHTLRSPIEQCEWVYRKIAQHGWR